MRGSARRPYPGRCDRCCRQRRRRGGRDRQHESGLASRNGTGQIAVEGKAGSPSSAGYRSPPTPTGSRVPRRDRRPPRIDRQWSPAEASWTHPPGQRAAEEILATHPAVEGFFASNDQIAIGISSVLSARDLSVPIVLSTAARGAVDQIRAGGPIVASATQDPVALVRAAMR